MVVPVCLMMAPVRPMVTPYDGCACLSNGGIRPSKSVHLSGGGACLFDGSARLSDGESFKSLSLSVWLQKGPP